MLKNGESQIKQHCAIIKVAPIANSIIKTDITLENILFNLVVLFLKSRVDIYK